MRLFTNLNNQTKGAIMQYDVLDMPVPVGNRRSLSYTYPQSQTLHSQSTVLQEEQNDEGEQIYRRVPRTTYPTPDSHYVIFQEDNDSCWKVYAGPFEEHIAAEIANALQLNDATEKKSTRSR